MEESGTHPTFFLKVLDSIILPVESPFRGFHPLSPCSAPLRGTTGMQALFGSAHSGAMNGLFADASVRQLSYTTDATTAWRLWSYNDGNVVTLP